MQTNSRGELIPVPKGNLLSLDESGPVEIGCESGAIWITQDNDIRDIVLSAGERFVSDRPGAVLVYALQPTVLTATALPARKTASFWQWVAAKLRSAPADDRGFATA